MGAPRSLNAVQIGNVGNGGIVISALVYGYAITTVAKLAIQFSVDGINPLPDLDEEAEVDASTIFCFTYTSHKVIEKSITFERFKSITFDQI